MDERNHDDHGGNESDLSDSPEHQVEGQHSSQRKSRTGNACLTCRRMKTRCEYFDDSSPCKLCAKANRECVKAPARRKRRKTVTRIADLEQRIQSLTSALIDNQDPVDANQPSSQKSSSKSPTVPSGRGNWTDEPDTQSRPASITPDVIDKGVVDKLTGYAAFERYRACMDVYYGFVPLPRKLDIDKYRRRKPLLFSTIVLAGINAIRPDLVMPISDDLLKWYADRIHYRGEKSLELVQCLLVNVCFHCRTLKREHINFYQQISTALTMILDLGVGRRLGNGVKPRWIAEEDMLDARRAFLGCYYSAGQAAVSLRHPLMLRWSPYVEECLEILSNNPDPAQDDVWLVDLIKLHHITEDVHSTFKMDDPISTISLKDPQTQYHLNALEQQLDRWRKVARSDLSSVRARLCSASVSMFIHEIALHSHHNIDSLRSPPDPEQLASFFNDMDIGPARIDALCTCLSSARSYLDTMLSLDMDTLRCLPNMYFVRSGYAAMTLKWLDEINIEVMSPSSNSTSTSTSGSNQTDRRSPSAFEVHFDSYMERMTQLYAEVGKGGKCNIASSFYHMLKMIHSVKLYSVRNVQPQKSPAFEVSSAPPLANWILSGLSQPPTQQLPFQDPIQISDPDVNLDFSGTDLDTAMFDFNDPNSYDPGFTTMGFWNVGGWGNLEVGDDAQFATGRM